MNKNFLVLVFCLFLLSLSGCFSSKGFSSSASIRDVLIEKYRHDIRSKFGELLCFSYLGHTQTDNGTVHVINARFADLDEKGESNRVLLFQEEPEAFEQILLNSNCNIAQWAQEGYVFLWQSSKISDMSFNVLDISRGLDCIDYLTKYSYGTLLPNDFENSVNDFEDLFTGPQSAHSNDIWDKMIRSVRQQSRFQTGVKPVSLNYVGNLHSKSGTGHVAVLSSVITGMLAPRGISDGYVFNDKAEIMYSFNYMPSWQHLRCYNGFLLSDVPMKIHSQDVIMLDFTESLSNPVIVR